MSTNDLQQQILKYLNRHQGSVLLPDLKALLDAKSENSPEFNQALYNLLAENFIECTLQGVSLYALPLAGYIDKIKSPVEKALVESYFNAQESKPATAQTKEAVKSFLKSRPLLEEDRFRDMFSQYKFDLNSFCWLFLQPTATYLYLKETCKKGKKDWRNLRHDNCVTLALKEATVDLMKSEGLCLNGSIVSFSPYALIEYILKQQADGFSEKDLFTAYHKILQAQMPIPSGLELNFSKFSMTVKSCENIIVGQFARIRFREKNLKKERQLLNKIKLNRYRNQYISAEVIYRNSQAELEKANVGDGFELIYLLRLFSDVCAQFDISFAKAPFLSLGKADATNQLRLLLNELSPVSAENLARAYELKYGLKASTVKASLMKELSQYSRNGIYDTQTKVITEKQLVALTNKLKNPWYYTAEVEQIFKRQVKNLYKEYMSTQNLLQLGYKKTSVIVYASQYASLDDCLDKTEWSGETFHVADELWAIPQIYSALQKRAVSWSIIEYAPQTYIRLSALKRNGIHKKHLTAFVSDILSKVHDETYFTMKSLQKEGISSTLDELGFEDTFYYSILKQSNRLSGRKIAGTYLFRKSKKDATVSDFIEYLLSELRSIDLFDLSELVADKYGISLTPVYIRTVIGDSTMYYDTISEKIFIDYNEYFKEI
ncbi:MAG: hypothetical protein R3Y06_09570 [Faecalibacterium sp.]